MVHVVHPTDGAASAIGLPQGWRRMNHTHTDGYRDRRVHSMHQNPNTGFPRFMGKMTAGDPSNMVHGVHPTVGAAGSVGPSGR